MTNNTGVQTKRARKVVEKERAEKLRNGLLNLHCLLPHEKRRIPGSFGRETCECAAINAYLRMSEEMEQTTERESEKYYHGREIV